MCSHQPMVTYHDPSKMRQKGMLYIFFGVLPILFSIIMGVWFFIIFGGSLIISGTNLISKANELEKEIGYNQGVVYSPEQDKGELDTFVDGLVYKKQKIKPSPRNIYGSKFIFCENCGYKMPENTIYCDSCGQNLLV